MGFSPLQFAAESDAVVRIHLNGENGLTVDIPLKNFVNPDIHEKKITNIALYSKLRQYALKSTPAQIGRSNSSKQFKLISYRKNEDCMIYFSDNNMLIKVFEAVFGDDMNDYDIVGYNDITTLHIYCKFVNQGNRMRIRASASNVEMMEKKKLLKKIRLWTEITKRFLRRKSEELMKKECMQKRREVFIHSAENILDAIRIHARTTSDLVSEILNESFTEENGPTLVRSSSHDAFSINSDADQGVEIIFGPNDGSTPSNLNVFFEPEVVECNDDECDNGISFDNSMLVDSPASVQSCSSGKLSIDSLKSSSSGMLSPDSLKSYSSDNLSYQSSGSLVQVSESDDDDDSWAILE